MGHTNDNHSKTRRGFFSSFLQKKEKVQLLTPDGKLVDVNKDVYEAALKNKKASNKEILEWMQNPSTKD